MNSNQDSPNMENFAAEIEADNSLSIDDFIKELEAKEKDLHIFSEMVIEVDESDLDVEDSFKFPPENTSVEKIPEINQTAKISAPKDFTTNDFELTKLKKETHDLQNQVSKMNSERLELVDLARRRQTDFENYKNRTERARNELYRNQLCTLAQQLLPVLDNMNRALVSATDISDNKTREFEQFFAGIGLVNQQLSEVLGEMGIQPINSVGEVFDPHLHEAVATEETDEVPPHIVTEEFRRGYRIEEKVIRPSMVKVSKSRE